MTTATSDERMTMAAGDDRPLRVLHYFWEPLVLGLFLLGATLIINVCGGTVLMFTMTNILIEVVMVIGLYIFIGNSGIIAFGHITYAMIGAYADAWLTMTPFKKGFALSLPGFLANNQFPMLPAAIAAGVFSGIVALITALPLMRMRGIAISIGTFAVMVIFNTVYANWDAWTFGASTLVGIPIYVNDWVAFGWVIAALVVATLYQKSRFGLALRASRDDAVAARASGIRVYRERVLAFGLSAAFMGIGGLLKAHFIGSIAVSAFWIPETFILIAMLMIGGQRSLTGAVVGAVAVSVITEVLRQFEAGLQVANSTVQMPHGFSELGLAVMMLAILIVRSSGLTNGREVPWPFARRTNAAERNRAEAVARIEASGPGASEATAGSRLEARDISVRFDGLAAISNLNLSMGNNEIVGLIGPNGAGKTTMVNVLTGFQQATEGDVIINGETVTRLGPLQRTDRGVARTFQAVRLFRDLTVLENLEAAAIGTGLAGAAARRRAWDVLVWMNLDHKAYVRANSLAYGDERRVGLARALAMAPRFVFLDEPAAGTNDAECDELMALIARIPKRFGCGVLLIEHNMRLVMGVCDRICVIDSGSKIAEGAAADIQRHPEVIRAYLGTRSEKSRA